MSGNCEIQVKLLLNAEKYVHAYQYEIKFMINNLPFSFSFYPQIGGGTHDTTSINFLYRMIADSNLN